MSSKYLTYKSSLCSETYYKNKMTLKVLGIMNIKEQDTVRMQ